MQDEPPRPNPGSEVSSAPRTSRGATGMWLAALVPLVGAAELGLHVLQIRRVVPESDWVRARDIVRAEMGPKDLVLFAPYWTDPIGRRVFGSELLGLDRAARADESRFVRAFEVATRGARRKETETWRVVAERNAGAITVRTLENPSPAEVIDDLTNRDGRSMFVSRWDGALETPCNFLDVPTQAGSTIVPQGPALPGKRYNCGSTYVGLAVLYGLDHMPRKCWHAPPPGGNGVLRVRFEDVKFGSVLHGHHGLQNVDERARAGPPITLSFSVEGQEIGRVVHTDGQGFRGFELPTPELSRKRATLTVEIRSSGHRHYCFEADTR